MCQPRGRLAVFADEQENILARYYDCDKWRKSGETSDVSDHRFPCFEIIYSEIE